MHAGNQLLSRLVFLTKYANNVGDRKEHEAEAFARVHRMHADMIRNRAPVSKRGSLLNHLSRAMKFVHNKDVSGSMRALQFAGTAMERNNVRGYNCSYMVVDSFTSFSEAMFVLMSGSGLGYSLERTSALPTIYAGSSWTFAIQDTKESWGEAIKRLFQNPNVVFDYSAIRPKGAPLSTGGVASGPEPLRESIENIRAILRKALGRQLTTIEVHDCMCHLAAAIHVGGVRRSAMIAIFDPYDRDMLNAKAGEWWNVNPNRRYANNSARVLAHDTECLRSVMRAMFNSRSGEPGVFIAETSNPYTSGTNPCGEVGLNHRQFCNLTEVRAGATDLAGAVGAAAFLGTLQAAYTSFPGLDPEWEYTTEREALLGVGLTGLADVWYDVAPRLRSLAGRVVATNIATADALGIERSARTTVIKPSGTNSLFLGCSSGIHTHDHGDHYNRRMTFTDSEPVLAYLREAFRDAPWQAIEPSTYRDGEFFLSVPCVATHGVRDAHPTDFLARVSHAYENWILPGHRSGPKHNVSATCNYTDGQEDSIVEFMASRAPMGTIGSVSFLPKDTHTYAQPILESLDAPERYRWLDENLPRILRGLDDAHLGGFDPLATAACAGGLCELPQKVA